MPAPVRIVIGEDDVLMREGIARLLAEAGFDVVAQAGDADALLRKALAYKPDVVVADVQMPPGHGDDGLRAALELRKQRPSATCSRNASATSRRSWRRSRASPQAAAHSIPRWWGGCSAAVASTVRSIY